MVSLGLPRPCEVIRRHVFIEPGQSISRYRRLIRALQTPDEGIEASNDNVDGFQFFPSFAHLFHGSGGTARASLSVVIESWRRSG